MAHVVNYSVEDNDIALEMEQEETKKKWEKVHNIEWKYKRRMARYHNAWLSAKVQVRRYEWTNLKESCPPSERFHTA